MAGPGIPCVAGIVIFLVSAKYLFSLTWRQLLVTALATFLVLQYCLVNCNPFKAYEDKYTLLSYIDPKYCPEASLLTDNRKWKFPVVVKPTCCARDTWGVKLLRTQSEFNEFKHGTKEKEQFMVQSYADFPYEVCILYEKSPWKTRGNVEAVGLRDIPESGITGSLCQNRPDLLTPALNRVIDKISRDIPEFYAGRYDIRAKSLECLKRGKGFLVLEVNTTMGFDNIRQSTLSPKSIYYGLRWLVTRLAYGASNIIKGEGVPLERMPKVYSDAWECGDWMRLFSVST